MFVLRRERSLTVWSTHSMFFGDRLLMADRGPTESPKFTCIVNDTLQHAAQKIVHPPETSYARKSSGHCIGLSVSVSSPPVTMPSTPTRASVPSRSSATHSSSAVTIESNRPRSGICISPCLRA